MLLQDALKRLTEYDPEISPVVQAVEPLSVLNATTVDEFRGQLIEAKEKITASRNALVNLAQ